MTQKTTAKEGTTTPALAAQLALKRGMPWSPARDLPWTGAYHFAAAPIIVLAKDLLAELGFPEADLGAVKKRDLAGLFLTYRSLGLEPLLLADALPFDKAAGEKRTGLEKFTAWALRQGARVSLASPVKSLWQTVSELCAGPVIMHPACRPFMRKSGLVLFLHEASLLAAANKHSNAGSSLGAGWYGERGWPCLLDGADVQRLAHQDCRWEDFYRQLPLFDAADSFAVQKAEDALPKKTPSLDGFADSLQKDGTWLDRDEALRLLEIVHMPHTTFAHVLAVSRVSYAIAQRMRLAGFSVQPELAASCGLVHDIAKGYAHHEKTGAMLLKSLGLTTMAHCIESHSDLALPFDQPVTEREIVYLADKYCLGSSFVPLEVRFRQKKELYQALGKSTAGIEKRLARALALEKRLAEELACSPEHTAQAALS